MLTRNISIHPSLLEKERANKIDHVLSVQIIVHKSNYDRTAHWKL